MRSGWPGNGSLDGIARGQEMSQLPPSLAEKLVPATAIAARQWPRPLVFTNGVFDVLHRGHVVYLEAARELGAALLVGINSDLSARQLGKGPNRPLNPETDRLLVVAALASVSFVTMFDEPTPCELLKKCRPDIYVKGGDYDMETLEETRLVRSWGGRSRAIPFVEGYSTSSLVERIRGGS
jgi:D-glycero-beta-D-manno-heptose 1-phosphate adenylyltransferase